MNPSSHTSIHTATHAYPYTSYGAFCEKPQSCHPSADYASGLYEDPSSSTECWSDEYAGLGPCSDADHALFEAFLTAEVASISPPGPCTVVPMQSPPAYYAEPAPTLCPYPTNGVQLHPELVDISQPYPYTTPSSQSAVSPAFEQAFPEQTASRISPTAYSPFPDVCIQGERSPTVMSQPSRAMSRHNQWSCPYHSPSPAPSPQASSSAITFNLQGLPTHTSHSPVSLTCEHPLPELTVTCISPDVVYPPMYPAYNHKHAHATDTSPPSSLRTSRHTTRRSSPSAPYPTPSPSPSPRASSSVIFASQRRNAPAPAAAPVSSQANTWQCPYCPHVQRNRRSPDLKRHIRTHTRDAEGAEWVCCGVPVMNATELGVPAMATVEAQVFEFDGVLMMGGCRKAFSRRDALKRHLRREKGRCFGDVLSLHQRGNREGR